MRHELKGILKKALLLGCMLSCMSQFSVLGQTDLDSLRSVWNNTAEFDTNRLKAIETLAWDGYIYNAPDSAFFYSKKHFKLAAACFKGAHDNEDFFIRHMASALNTCGSSKYFLGDYDSALVYFKKSLTLRRELEDKQKISNTLKNMGAIHGELGNYDSAASYLAESIELGKQIDDQKGLAISYNSMGIVYKAQGMTSLAINEYNKALNIFTSLDDKRMIAVSLNNIASLYRLQGDYEQSLDFFKQSLAMRTALDDKQGILTSLNNLGRLYLRLEDEGSMSPDSARRLSLACHEKAQSLANDLGNKKELALAMNGLGHGVLRNGEPDLALVYFIKALDIRKELGKKAGISSSLNLIAEAYMQKADDLQASDGRQAKELYAEAISYSEEALQQAQQINHLVQVVHSASILTHCFKQRGEFAKALTMHELWSESEEELRSEENEQELIHQKYRYTYEKKSLMDSLAFRSERQDMIDKESAFEEELDSKMTWILILSLGLLGILAAALIYRLHQKKRRLEILAEAHELRFQSAESEMKALRSQMNPHFIFNALQSIQTFLITQDSEEANQYLLKFSKLMRAVLENSEKDEIPIIKEVNALRWYMELESLRLKHPFTFDIAIDESVDAEDDMIPPLLLQPVVENAIWHGLQHKSEAGHLQVDIERQGRNIICTVKDNGIGRKASRALRQDWNIKKQSMGMKITEERIKLRDEMTQTHGSVKVVDLESLDGEALGTKVELIIPVLE